MTITELPTREAETLDAGVKPERQTQSHSASSKSAPGFDFFQWFHSKIAPKSFFVGIFIAFICCSLCGQLTKKNNIFRNFQRFHQGTDPVSCFFPTFSEVRKIVTSKVAPGQTLVIVGGNSIMNGCGQPVDKLWTKRLQEILGPKFCVINLAFRSAHPFNCGYFVAEALRKEYPDLIFVTTANPGDVGPVCTGSIYSYFYWQALYSGQLISDAARFKAVEEELEKDPTGHELQLCGWLNNSLGFSELWNTVAMRWFSTVWHQEAVNPFCARKQVVDFTPPPAPVSERYLKYFDLDLKYAGKSTSEAFEKSADNQWTLARAFWKDFQKQATSAIPQEMRRHILVVQIPNSPYFIKLLKTDEQKRQLIANVVGPQKWKEVGYHSILAGADFTEEDFFDRVHLAPSGGAKLADQVAPEIIRINKSGAFPAKTKTLDK